MKNLKLSILFALLFVLQLHAQTPQALLRGDYEIQEHWVDSVYNKLSIDERIGQLFMIAAYSNRGQEEIDKIKTLITKHKVGGLIFFQGGPMRQAQLTNKYQAMSKIPLLIAQDAEWGLAMRLDSTYRFPWNMTLGAIKDTKLIQKVGEQLGKHCNALGVHINFAPVVDINTNPINPIIGNRSYGENKENVADKAIAFSEGMQSYNVLACAKHFPGHGDTSQDSHKTLPKVDFSFDRIWKTELYPYRKLFDKGLGSVMIAHLNVPALTLFDGVPTSISKRVVTDLLQTKMGFNGLVFTDALTMKGASNFAEDGAIDLAAFLAGADVLLMPNDVQKGIDHLKEAYKKHYFDEKRLAYSVKKILRAKYWAGLNNYKPIALDTVNALLHSKGNQVLHRQLVEASLTTIKNSDSLLPIKHLEKQKIAYYHLGNDKGDTFYQYLDKYVDIVFIKTKDSTALVKALANYTTVIVGHHKDTSNPWKSYHFADKDKALLALIAKHSNAILVNFTSPYALNEVDTSGFKAIVEAYQNDKLVQETVPQLIFGAIDSKGALPVSIGKTYKAGFGLQVKNIKRLGYATPEFVGMSSDTLKQIDSIAQRVIGEKMAPGMQFLVAKDGRIVYHKIYGYFTYDKKQKVKGTDIYDLASVTKILGAMPMILKAYDDGKYKIEDRMDKLFPVLVGSNKDTVTIKQALSHYGRLKPWIPFYVETLDSITKKPIKGIYSKKYSKKYSYQVAREMYMRNDWYDTILKRIAEAPQRIHWKYKYSGFPFYLFKDYAEKQYHKPLDKLDNDLFYAKIGAKTLGYNPLKRFDKKMIVPTEKDDYYRHQLLQGYVHDMGAAMFGGVGGNAGLFGSAEDVAKMMQMYMQKGYYGGDRFFSEKTFDTFNKRYFEKDSVRRGLGFDKPQLNPEITATCGCVSGASFGHSGFTGTFAWADPKTNLVYVFLSNRVYPVMRNNKLGKQNIRTNVQQVIQNAILPKEVKKIVAK